MTCSDFRRFYSDFADGMLDERAEVSSHGHLAECPSCRRFHLALQRGLGALRRRPALSPSIDFTARLEQRLELEARNIAPAVSGVGHWSSTAAACLILTGLALLSVEATRGARTSRPGVPHAASGAFALPFQPAATTDSLPNAAQPAPTGWHLNAALRR